MQYVFLCKCIKDRSSDMMTNIVSKEFKAGKIPEIRDYMLDMHTKKGQEMGRDVKHFLEVASKVEPEKKGAHKGYLERLLKLIEKENN